MQKLFEKNIKFLYENIPHYYELIKNLKTRNYLIKEDNIFDKAGNKLYPNSITQDSKTFAFFPTHNNLWEKKFFYIEPSYLKKEFFVTGKIINKLINKAKTIKNYSPKGFYFEKNFLPTTAIFGLLAGKHLDILVNNFEFQSLFVYEPNPEFFAISLYFVDYEKIYNKLNERFFLWVNGTLDYYAIEKFYYERKITSSFLSLFLKTYNHPLIEDAIAKFNEVRVTKLRGWGTYEDEIKGIKNHIKNLNKYKTLLKKQKLNIPICVIANGKSLEKNIEFIKKNKNSMILISVGTAIKPLIKAGIQSDFHIEQERVETLIEALKDVLPKYNGYFIGASVVNPKVFKMAKNPLMYHREAFSLSQNYVIGSSPIVGNAGFSIATYFTNEIYLCGMDLGFRLNTNKHASNSFYDNKNDKAIEGIKVKGNFSDDIYSDSLLLSSKQNIEKIIKILNLKVYNLSDGAYIEGTIPLKDKTLPKINKKEIIEKMLNSFEYTNYSLPNVNLNSLIKPLKESFKKPITSYKILTGIIDFIEDILNSKKASPELILLRGSISHILNNFYILSHKIDSKEIPTLQKRMTKDLNLFIHHFESLKKEINSL